MVSFLPVHSLTALMAAILDGKTIGPDFGLQAALAMNSIKAWTLLSGLIRRRT